jgi:HAD superfamily hydrolase (TIGR01490 family)
MNLALFDFDNTITDRDTFTDFVRYSANPGRIALGRLVLLPLLVRYKLGLVSQKNARIKVAKFAFRDRNDKEIRMKGEEYSRSEIPRFIKPIAHERILWHKKNGDVVVVVSASLDVYLIDWCNQNGLQLICSELESIKGVLTGKYKTPDCSGKEKERRIRNAYNLNEYDKIFAYGDSTEDLSMLQLADVKYFRWKEIL